MQRYWWRVIFCVLLAAILPACRRADDGGSVLPGAPTPPPLASDAEMMAQLIGFEWELPQGSFLSLMNEGILAVNIGLPLPLDEAESLVIETFTANGYAIDSSAGAPDANNFIRSYVFVKGDTRLNVVLNSSSSFESSTSLGITAQ